jgi:hypothetical protein
VNREGGGRVVANLSNNSLDVVDLKAGKLAAGVLINPGLVAQNDSDALSASSQAAALPATQTLGTVGAPTTVTGNGGLNVVASTATPRLRWSSAAAPATCSS